MPFRLARHTRTVWQYRHVMALSGLLPPDPGISRDRLPPATASLLHQEPRWWSLTSTRSTSASRRTDSVNDIEALTWAARGVAMGDAPDHVRAAADEVTGTLDEFGVVDVLRSVTVAR